MNVQLVLCLTARKHVIVEQRALASHSDVHRHTVHDAYCRLVDVGLVYMMPSHQVLATVTMRGARKQVLFARATHGDFLVFEDDYKAEINFVRARGLPVRSLDTSSHAV